MSDNIFKPKENLEIPEETKVESVDRLTKLKQQAQRLGLKHSNNIGEDTLAKMIQDKIDGNVVEEEPETQDSVEDDIQPVKVARKETRQETRMRVFKESMKLIRVRITNHNPQKSNWPGEIVTVQNSYIPKVSRFIPLGENSEDSTHIENIVYRHLKSKKYLQIRKRKDKKTGREVVDKKLVPEYSIEVLPPLTKQELNDLAVKQFAAEAATS